MNNENLDFNIKNAPFFPKINDELNVKEDKLNVNQKISGIYKETEKTLENYKLDLKNRVEGKELMYVRTFSDPEFELTIVDKRLDELKEKIDYTYWSSATCIKPFVPSKLWEGNGGRCGLIISNEAVLGGWNKEDMTTANVPQSVVDSEEIKNYFPKEFPVFPSAHISREIQNRTEEGIKLARKILDFGEMDEVTEIDAEDAIDEFYKGEIETLKEKIPLELHSLSKLEDVVKTFGELAEKADGKELDYNEAKIHYLAKNMSNGDYCDERNAPAKIKLEYGDPINCLATLPAQYGVGFWTKHKVIDLTVISKLTWKEFNPEVNLSQYLDENGNPLPNDINLLDKCCLIVKVEIQAKPVHFVVLHTMPAYNFGFEKSPNVARNGDQLALLQWLLTGKTYFNVPPLKDDKGNILQSLQNEKTVIAMGDLNEDWRKKEQPGAKYLNEIHDNTSQFHIYPWGKTTEIGTHGENTIDLQLDYMISKGIEILPGSEKVGPIDPVNLSDHGLLTTTFII